MGSANCKEYKTNPTTTTNGNAESLRRGKAAGICTSGKYSTTGDKNMDGQQDGSVNICHIDDIKENEMKQFNIDEDNKILLIKQNGQMHALGNKCPHYGAPLHLGALGSGRVRCQWHGACFSIETGDIEDFPGMDSLPCYAVDVDSTGVVRVKAPRELLQKNKRVRNMVRYTEYDERCFIVVGGGPSGAVCAETLRQYGFTGRIIMVCRENSYPYDRVKISKALDISLDKLEIRDSEFYKEHSIEVLLGVEAQKLDTVKNTLILSDKTELKYDKIYIATGCSAKKAPIEGADFKCVYTLRDHADGQAIINSIDPESYVICLGSSFIAMESAAYLAKKVKQVTLVGRGEVPLKELFGTEIGKRILRLYEENGVKMIMNSGIEEIYGTSQGVVREVKLKDGSKLPCDVLIMGTGSSFNTEWLLNSELKVNENGTIDTDMNLMTNLPNVYAGGDIANAPVFSNANQRTTINHYQLAQYHGRIAAINMSGGVKELRAVPFFFTMLFGKGFRYSGYGKFADVLIEGDLENFKFVAYFCDENDNVVAVASCGRDPIVAQFAELQHQGKRLHRSDVEGKSNPEEWTEKIAFKPC